MLIGQDMVEALNAQMGREFAAHFQYLAASAHFAGEGLPQLAGFFRGQADEEHVHAMKFFRFIEEAGGQVVIPTVEAPRSHFESADEVVGLAIEWELEVTRHINELVALAERGSDYATRAFLQWFVTEQVEEVATMTELLQVVRRAGEANLLLVEDYVHRRQPAAAAAADGA